MTVWLPAAMPVRAYSPAWLLVAVVEPMETRAPSRGASDSVSYTMPCTVPPWPVTGGTGVMVPPEARGATLLPEPPLHPAVAKSVIAATKTRKKRKRRVRSFTIDDLHFSCVRKGEMKPVSPDAPEE